MSKHKTFISGICLTLLLFAIWLAIHMLPIKTIQANNATIWYVNVNAEGNNDGSNWGNAFTDLQNALAVAQPGAEIWIAAGIYKPTNDETDREATFQLVNDVALYGGFAGYETTRAERNWVANVTVLSGDIDNNDFTDPNGVVTNTLNINGANSYHVMMGSGITVTAVLDGFTITAGQAHEPPSWGVACGSSPHLVCGGGMHNMNSSPTLANIFFSGNNASGGYGGGMYNQDNSSPTLTNVSFSGNRAGRGGGMYTYGGNPILTNVSFSDNHAADFGGGMRNSYSGVMLTNVSFSDNSAVEGGGMANYGNPSPTLINVSFSNNNASSGGGMSNRYSNPILIDVLFMGNNAHITGGGMDNVHSSPMLTYTLFLDNGASAGGGMYNDVSHPILAYVSFNVNHASQGGGMSSSGGNPILVNTFFSGNSADRGGGMHNSRTNSLKLINVSFNGNSANEHGGGMYNRYQASPVLTNVSFSGNNAGGAGGGMFNSDDSEPVIQNNIFWGNQDSSGTGTATASITNLQNSIPAISYSLVQGSNGSGETWNNNVGIDLGNNLDDDPLFIDPPDPANAPTMAGNLRLQADSPAVDAGNNDYIVDIITDLAGHPRIYGPSVDMGPFETLYGLDFHWYFPVVRK